MESPIQTIKEFPLERDHSFYRLGADVFSSEPPKPAGPSAGHLLTVEDDARAFGTHGRIKCSLKHKHSAAVIA